VKSISCTMLLAGSLAILAASPTYSVSITLGDQDYADGALELGGPGGFIGRQTGEPAPIGLVLGDDPGGTAFSASWTFTYALGAVSTASIVIGIIDHDSAAAGSQVAAFSVDGVDLTAALDTLFEASGGTQLEVNVYTLPLTGGALSVLGDGTATFSLTLQGPHCSFLPGVCTTVAGGNAAGLDFVTLDFTQGSTQVTAPATLLLASLGLGVLATTRRRQAR
jgi:hypothetical protein